MLLASKKRKVVHREKMQEHMASLARAQKGKMNLAASRAMEHENVRMPQVGEMGLEAMPVSGGAAGLARVVGSGRSGAGRAKAKAKQQGSAPESASNSVMHIDPQFGVINEPKPVPMTASRQGEMLAAHMQKTRGAGWFDDFKSGFMSVIRPVASVVKTVAGLVPHPAAQAVSGALGALGAGKAAPPAAAAKAKAVNDARKRRGAEVSRLMREKHMSLPEASRYIKEHGSA